MANEITRRRPRLLTNSSVRWNIVAPLVAYLVLARNGMSTVDALAVAALFPAAGGVLVLARGRKVDPFAVLSLTSIAIGLTAALAFHDGRILLVKESLTTGALGMVFLGSLLASKPLIFTLRRRLFVGDRPDAQAAYDRTWQSPSVRTEARRITAIWGIALLVEAAARVGLSYVLPATVMVTISPLLGLTLAPLGVWTLRPRAGRPTEPGPPDALSPTR
ncbi:VC0807 family protein [Spirillospora sp. NPDC052269]